MADNYLIEGRNFIYLLKIIEKKVKPAFCTYLHFNYWPILRFLLNANRKNGKRTDVEDRKKTVLKIASKNVRKEFYNAACKVCTTGETRLKDLHAFALQRDWEEQFSHLPQADVLFLTRKSQYKKCKDGRISEHLCDGVRVQIENTERCITLVDADPRNADEHFFLPTQVLTVDPKEKVIELRFPGCLAELWAQDDILNTVSRVNAALPDHLDYLRLDGEDVLSRIMGTSQKMMYWVALLERIRPKIIFLTSYSGMPHVCAAGKLLGIRVVDIQHGGMHGNHPLVANWHKRPRAGYELLPDVFWCWDERSARYINKEKWPPHTAVVGGNPKTALEYTLHGETSLSKKISEQHRPQVLVGLQYGSDPMTEEHVLGAYKATRDTIDWRFRLHPLGWSFLGEVAAKFEIPEDEVRLESEKPLHHVLPEIDLILCNASTLIYEALDLGAAGAVWSHKGTAIFDDLVKSRQIHVATDFDKLMRVLSNLTQTDDNKRVRVSAHERQMLNRETIKSTATKLIRS